MFAAAADHDATAIAAAYTERAFFHRGQNDHALGLVDEVLRNIVGNIQDFLEDDARVFYPIFFMFIVGKGRRPEIEDQEQMAESFS
jgi:hypothetical protein